MNYVLDNFFNEAVLTVSMESDEELREMGRTQPCPSGALDSAQSLTEATWHST